MIVEPYYIDQEERKSQDLKQVLVVIFTDFMMILKVHSPNSLHIKIIYRSYIQ